MEPQGPWLNVAEPGALRSTRPLHWQAHSRQGEGEGGVGANSPRTGTLEDSACWLSVQSFFCTYIWLAARGVLFPGVPNFVQVDDAAHLVTDPSWKPAGHELA